MIMAYQRTRSGKYVGEIVSIYAREKRYVTYHLLLSIAD